MIYCKKKLYIYDLISQIDYKSIVRVTEQKVDCIQKWALTLKI